MDVLVSVVGSLASKAAEYTVDPAAQQLSYVFKPRSKFLNLRSKVQELKDARERVQQSVDSANRKGEVIFYDVQRWLTVANEKISEEAATQLQEDEEKAMKRCFAGFCSDFKSGYRLSKKADKEANAIAQLLIQKDNFEGVSYPSDPKGIDFIRPVKEYEVFGSNLNYFSIGLKGSSFEIPNNFFKGMQRLKVLEFGRTNFTALPSSICSLKTLCTLRLSSGIFL